MGRAAYLQNNFTAGEISPRLNSRTDLTRYKNGLKTLQNMTIMPHGGVTSRPGTVFVAPAKETTKDVRLIDFVFSTAISYVIEMGDEYFRFFSSNSQIRLTGQDITGITQANPAVVTYSGSDTYSNGDRVFITGVQGMTQVNNREFIVANVDTGANTFELSGINSSAYDSYTSGGTVEEIYEIVSPYDSTDIFDLKYVQSADVMFIAHPEYKPRQLARSGDTDWTISEVDFIDGPYLPINTDTTVTLTPSGGSYAKGDTPTVTASSTTGINGGDGFQTTDVGRLLRIKNGSNWAWGEITARSSTTVITVEVKSDTAFPSTAEDEWRLGAWSDTTGYPRAIAFYENRLVFGGTDAQPDTIWGSAQDDYTNFSPGTNDSDAFNFTLVAEQLNIIQWLSPQKTLRAGSTGSEFSVSGGSVSGIESITPTNVKVSRETQFGSNSIDALLVENATLFWQRAGRKLREFVYSFEIDGFVGVDLSLISEHITTGGVVEMAYQAEPDGIVWIPRNDGALLGMTYLRSQDVVGWHRHLLGGTDTKVTSVATIPVDSQDQVWLVVERTINGSTVKYIERIGDTFINSTTKNAVFLDSSLSTFGETPSATLTPASTTGSSVTFTAGSSVFASTDVGREIRSGDAKAIITGYTSGTQVTANIVADFASTSAIASGSWTLSRNTISGLNHLEGETVSLLVDGGTHPNVVVSGGEITMNGQYTTVHIGYGYEQIIESLSFEAGSSIGTAQGSRTRITDLTVNLYETVGFKAGRDAEHLKTVDFRRPSDVQDEGVPLFTGEKKIRPSHGWQDSGKILIKQEQPLPLTVLGYTVKIEVSDAP